MNKPSYLTLPSKKGVYVIRCVKNGMVYIGASKNIKYRVGTHFSHLRTRMHHSKKMQDDFTLYLEKSFIAEVICFTQDDYETQRREQECLDNYISIGKSYNGMKVSSYRSMLHSASKVGKRTISLSISPDLLDSAYKNIREMGFLSFQEFFIKQLIDVSSNSARRGASSP